QGEVAALELGLDAPVAGRTTVVQRQLAIGDVGNEVGAPHGEAAHAIRLDVLVRLEEIVLALIAVGETVGAVENEVRVVEEIDDVRRGGAAKQQSGMVRRVDEA